MVAVIRAIRATHGGWRYDGRCRAQGGSVSEPVTLTVFTDYV
jgi:hypothetical protein